MYRQGAMKILQTNKYDVELEDGSILTHNELMWNFRSQCCGAALKMENEVFLCKQCDQACDVLHKRTVHNQKVLMQENIEALPEEYKQLGMDGFYKSINEFGEGLKDLAERQKMLEARITHIRG
jgi:hypothetical protein